VKNIRVGEIEVSRLAYGCMRIAGDGSRADRERGKRAVHAAIDAGYTLFDHADIYAGGQCESLFGEIIAATPSLRDRVKILTKCGIRFAGDPNDESPGRYDFSAQHILASVDGSLRRLGVDKVDLLLLHRPDYLADFREVAEALSSLHESGKVAGIGVSNFSPSQVDVLQSNLELPIVVNQVEINLHNIGALTNGVLDQCMARGIRPQAWGPIAAIAYKAWGNTFNDDDEARIRAEVSRQAARYCVEDWIVPLLWLLKHPAGISPIIGSTTAERIQAALRALEVDYARVDWYRLLEARNGVPVP